MKAAVLHGKGDVRVEEIEVPQLQPDEILIRVKATGICGSDVPRLFGDAARFYPIVLGHEFAGIVDRVGSQVSRVKVGERIAGVPLLPCHRCVDCQLGNFAQCRHYSFVGSRVNGSWADYVKLPEANAIPIGSEIGFEQASFLEPSSVALHALRLIGYRGGENVVVLGGGNIGLLALQWARILGARTTTVCDIDDQRLATARKLGADYVLNTRHPDFNSQWTELTNGRGYGVVLETAGSHATMKLSFELAASKAKVIFVGTPVGDITFNPKLFEQLNRKEFTLSGSWMSYSAPFPGNEWELSLNALHTERLNVTELVAHRFPLSSIHEAMELYQKPGGVKGKIVLLN